METIRTVGDAIDYAEKTIEALRLKAEELDPSARPAFETKAADVVRDLSQMVPDPDLRARFGRELAEPFPPGSGDTRLSDAMSSGAPAAQGIEPKPGPEFLSAELVQHLADADDVDAWSARWAGESLPWAAAWQCFERLRGTATATSPLHGSGIVPSPTVARHPG